MSVTIDTLAYGHLKVTKATVNTMVKLLDYCATQYNVMNQSTASDMTLYVYSKASYLSENDKYSREGEYFYVSNKQLNLTQAQLHESLLPSLNGTMLIISTLMKSVLSSASEADLGTLFLNVKETSILQNSWKN